MSKEDFSYAPEEVRREWDEIYGELQERGDYRAEEWRHFTPTFLDTQSQDFSLTQTYELLAEKQNLIMAEKIGQPEATVKVHTTLPVTLFTVGDIHHGSIFTNEELWQEHREAILNTPGAYVVFLHNLTDNAIPTKFANNILNNTIPPDVQFKSMQRQIKELDEAGKVLGAIEGDCHEGWSWASAGVNSSNLLYGYEGRNFPVLENGAVLNLIIGEETYQVGLWHKQGPFNSNFNPEHSLRQNRRLGARQTDVEVGAHHHVSVATMDYEGYKNKGKPVAYIRVGTYKGWWPNGDGMNDRYVVDRWGKSGEPPGNSVMLHPFHHEVEATLGFDSGLRKHDAIRIALWLETMGKKADITSLIKG